MVDSRAPSLPSTVLILVERLDCFSSSPAIVGAFAEALISLDVDCESEKDEGAC